MKLTQKRYKVLVNRAKVFIGYLSGDAGMIDRDVNKVALESMLAGWLTSTKEFDDYVKRCRKLKQDGSEALIIQDLAAQAASDAITITGTHRRFAKR